MDNLTIDWTISVSNIISVFFGIISVIFGIISIFQSKKAKNNKDEAKSYSEEADKYYKLMTEEIEKTKKIENESKESTRCVVEMIKLEQAKYMLKIINVGNSIAKNIEFEVIEGAKFNFHMDNRNEGFPILELDSKQSIGYYVLIPLVAKDSSSRKYKLKWDNENGKEKIKEGTLIFPKS